MTKFTGFCTYPHGGYLFLALFVTLVSALTCTMYGAASCRLAHITFTNDVNLNFEAYFNSNSGAQLNTTASSSSLTTFEAGVGLYQWLQPRGAKSVVDSTGKTVTTSSVWNEGQCVGYYTTMLDSFSDQKFETARGFAVFAVMLAFGVTGWCLFTACLWLNVMQSWLIRILCLAGTAASASTFVFFQSELCTSEFTTVRCELDNGGLVMCAAVLFWFTSSIIAFVFFKPAGSRDIAELPRAKIVLNPKQTLAKVKNKLHRKKENTASTTTTTSKNQKAGIGKVVGKIKWVHGSDRDGHHNQSRSTTAMDQRQAVSTSRGASPNSDRDRQERQQQRRQQRADEEAQLEREMEEQEQLALEEAEFERRERKKRLLKEQEREERHRQELVARMAEEQERLREGALRKKRAAYAESVRQETIRAVAALPLPPALSQERQQPHSPRHGKRKTRLTVDDITNDAELEVYLSNIDRLSDV